MSMMHPDEIIGAKLAQLEHEMQDRTKTILQLIQKVEDQENELNELRDVVAGIGMTVNAMQGRM